MSPTLSFQFKREIVADMMKALDENPEDEEKRRRFKKSYFMLKSRFHTLEGQLEQQHYSQRSSGSAAPPPLMNGHSKPQERPQFSRKNGQDQPSTSTSPPPQSTSPSGSTKDSPGSSKLPKDDRRSRKSHKKYKSSENVDETSKIDGKAEETVPGEEPKVSQRLKQPDNCTFISYFTIDTGSSLVINLRTDTASNFKYC